MVTRFRYTDRRGDELELKDLKELEVHVASGRIDGDTPLFDALTGERGPARRHDAYRFVLDELDGVDAEGLPLLGVTPAESAESGPTTEELAARLRKERDEELAVPGWVVGRSGRSDGNRTLLEGGRSEGRVTGHSGAVGTPGEDGPADEEGGAGGEGSSGEPRAPDGAAPRAEPRRIGWLSLAVRPFRTAGLVVVLLGVAYLALYAQPGAVPAAEGVRVTPSSGADVSVDVPGDALDPVDALAASEGVAFGQMVEAMDSLAQEHRVYQVPAVWLEGEYLADASAHPQVGAYWIRYLGFVRELRREDARLFRRSFVTRLTDLDISPTVVTLRLAQAVEGFEGSQERRDGLYDRMEGLATSALEFHRLLVERDDDLEYLPPDRAYVGGDPFLRLHTEDAELRERIYDLLARMFDHVEAIHGRTAWTRDGLNDGILSSIRSTGDAAAGAGEDGLTGGAR